MWVTARRAGTEVPGKGLFLEIHPFIPGRIVA